MEYRSFSLLGSFLAASPYILPPLFLNGEGFVARDILIPVRSHLFSFMWHSALAALLPPPFYDWPRPADFIQSCAVHDGESFHCQQVLLPSNQGAISIFQLPLPREICCIHTTLEGLITLLLGSSPSRPSPNSSSRLHFFFGKVPYLLSQSIRLIPLHPS